jgi:hypothetical protein
LLVKNKVGQLQLRQSQSRIPDQARVLAAICPAGKQVEARVEAGQGENGNMSILLQVGEKKEIVSRLLDWQLIGRVSGLFQLMTSPREVHAQFARRLQSLNNTAECIKSTTRLFYNLHAKDGVRMWLNEMRGASLDRRLPFLYVANDVMQHRHVARKDFVQEFAKVLELAMQLITQHPKTNQKATRMVKVK